MVRSGGAGEPGHGDDGKVGLEHPVFRPGLPVIAMTGFAGSAHPDRRLPLLVKPVSKPVLVEAVRNARIRRAILASAPRVEQRSRARRLREAAGNVDHDVDLMSAVQLLRGLAD